MKVLVAIIMDSIKIQYSSFGVTAFPIILILGGIVGPIVLDVMSIDAIHRGKTGAIYFLIGMTLIALILLPFIYLSIKSFIGFAKNQPAIELTPEYYIDNIEKVKVSWKNISNIWTLTLQSSFLKITVVDNSVIYSQTKSAIWKFVFWINAWNGGILSINLSLLRGKNADIINLIKNYHQTVTKNLTAVT